MTIIQLLNGLNTNIIVYCEIVEDQNNLRVCGYTIPPKNSKFISVGYDSWVKTLKATIGAEPNIGTIINHFNNTDYYTRIKQINRTQLGLLGDGIQCYVNGSGKKKLVLYYPPYTNPRFILNSLKHHIINAAGDEIIESRLINIKKIGGNNAKSQFYIVKMNLVLWNNQHTITEFKINSDSLLNMFEFRPKNFNQITNISLGIEHMHFNNTRGGSSQNNSHSMDFSSKLSKLEQLLSKKN